MKAVIDWLVNTRVCHQVFHSHCSGVLLMADINENVSKFLTELNVPGFKFHGLRGLPKRYSIHINGPWCITFEWEEGDALRVDLEQYH